jgi:L-lactate dehydrogenase complex protein LldG
MSRDSILKAIRQNIAEVIPLPDYLIIAEQESAESRKEIFLRNLVLVGADFFELKLNENIASFCAEHFPEALDFGTYEAWTEYSSDCPKEKLNQLDTVILGGQMGVAENGAIWLSESNFHNRLIPFIAQQVIILLNYKKIVSTMEEAYSLINLSDTGFGVFISGPSKTADIEQSLVYGAHGAKKLTVVIY